VDDVILQEVSAALTIKVNLSVTGTSRPMACLVGMRVGLNWLCWGPSDIMLMWYVHAPFANVRGLLY